MGLSETKSHSGESGSPKRGREEFCVWLSTNPRLGEEIWVFERMRSRSGKMAHLSEKRWCNHCFMLTQARWTSLSDPDGLAWARVLGLSELLRISMLACACVGGVWT